jgi:hypothetical protein
VRLSLFDRVGKWHCEAVWLKAKQNKVFQTI